MQNKPLRTAITASLVAALLVIPMQAEETPQPRKSEQPQQWALALCVVAVCGAAIAGVYIVSKKCEPKYYWLMDDSEQPPKFWVGCPTSKECSINGWKRIGGPYSKISDAPPVHPDPTNRVSSIEGPQFRIAVQQTTNMVNWTTVHEEINDLEEFVYWPTNAGLYRLEIGN